MGIPTLLGIPGLLVVAVTSGTPRGAAENLLAVRTDVEHVREAVRGRDVDDHGDLFDDLPIQVWGSSRFGTLEG